MFLTIGLGMGGWSVLSHEETAAAGVRFPTLKLPPALGRAVARFSENHLLARPAAFGLRHVEAVEAVCLGNARYLGIRLEPK